MNKHASKLAEIENQLADSELYSAENKEKLTALSSWDLHSTHEAIEQTAARLQTPYAYHSGDGTGERLSGNTPVCGSDRKRMERYSPHFVYGK